MLKPAWIGQLILLVVWAMMATGATAMPDNAELSKLQVVPRR